MINAIRSSPPTGGIDLFFTASALSLYLFINRYKERAEAVKNRSIPPVGGDDRMAFIKQAETDFQDYMIIADSEFTVEEDYLVFKYKLDS